METKIIQISKDKKLIMAERYSLYLQEKNKKKSLSTIHRILFEVNTSLTRIWNIVGRSILEQVVPLCIRGPSSQYQAFQQNCNKSVECQNLISLNSIEYNIKNSKNVLGILYSRDHFDCILHKLTEDLGLKLRKQFELCPIQIQGQLFKKQYQQKIGFQNPMILIFWKGLFDQLIILEKINLNQQTQIIIKSIQNEIIKRKKYQQQIKDLSMNTDQDKQINQQGTLYKINTIRNIS